MNETIHWEQHEPFRISILGQVISHETILWLCPLRKICWEMSDIKQHWCSLLENFSYLLCFASLARVQIKKNLSKSKIIHFFDRLKLLLLPFCWHCLPDPTSWSFCFDLFDIWCLKVLNSACLLRSINECTNFQGTAWACQNFILLSSYFGFCDYDLNFCLKLVLTFMQVK